MSYQPFKLRKPASAPTTLATLATVHAEPAQSVATVATVAEAPPDPDEAKIEKCKGVAADGVPQPYLDAQARLQCQQPMGVEEADWRQAINDAGRFLDQWAILAAEFQWTAGDLFDLPREGKPGGLMWFVNGETVRSFGPEGAFTTGGRAFDRVTRDEWVNPYHRNQR